jgi:hypothetical protein
MDKYLAQHQFRPTLIIEMSQLSQEVAKHQRRSLPCSLRVFWPLLLINQHSAYAETVHLDADLECLLKQFYGHHTATTSSKVRGDLTQSSRENVIANVHVRRTRFLDCTNEALSFVFDFCHCRICLHFGHGTNPCCQRLYL